MKRLQWQNWSALQLCAGIVAILLFGPGLIFTFVPGLHDRLLGSDALARLGWGPLYGLIFGVLFAAGVVSFFAGLREITRPPSFLYRMTHPRLPRWARRRPVWPLS
jgi:hypothetical protein